MKRFKTCLQNLTIVMITTLLTLGAIEIFLRFSAKDFPVVDEKILNSTSYDPPKELYAIDEQRRALFTLPNNWIRREVVIPGLQRAEYWHGVLHVYDVNKLRFSSPIPEKKKGVYRLLVVGDSLAYGYGIDEKFRFSDLLSRWMGIEVINIGKPGDQSSDILEKVKKFVPLLKPDGVLYAVCLNDYLPSGAKQFKFKVDVPTSNRTTKYLMNNFHFATLLNEGYRTFMQLAGLKLDFYGEILENFANYHERFQKDITAMNKFVMDSGLPPMLTLVLDQHPKKDTKRHNLTRKTEEYLAKAGFTVIPTEEYFAKYDLKSMRVSRWEGHPNEIANWIWARMIEKTLNHHK